jgi:hypothetical protein
MDLSCACKITIALVAILVPTVPLGFYIGTMRYAVLPRRRRFCERVREGYNWLAFSVGVTERTAAILLSIFLPNYLGWFIGGWMAYKYAVNWQQHEKVAARDKSLMALVGTAWSFIMALAAGFLINPDALRQLGSHGH